jgi:multiple sugar transport system substrate-binding protein
MKRTWWERCLLLILLLSIQVNAQDEPVVITWFIGLGVASDPGMVEFEKELIEEFNASQTEIRIELMCGCGGGSPKDDLITAIVSLKGPDIVGPITAASASEFREYWLDLQPLVDKTGYDLSQFPPNLVDIHRSPQGLTSLPFAAYPGVLYYNADLFDVAGLNYPPTVPGMPYIMPDGTAVPWDYDTVTMIAQRLTLDTQGNTANSVDFDPKEIVQYGFAHQWDNLLSDFYTFGPAPLLDDAGQVVIHEQWRKQAHWMWDAIWTYHFIPSFDRYDTLYYTNLFETEQGAMIRSMSWYTCCIENLSARWDLAVQPAYEDQIYAPLDVDNFYITKITKHPDEAFTVLQYLLGEAAPELLEQYDVFPARPDLYDEALRRKAEQYPQVQNWDVVTTSIPLAPAIHHQMGFPNSIVIYLEDFLYKLRGTGGDSLDLDAELDQLEADLQKAIDTAR